MKVTMRSKTAKSEPLEQRFKRFATALMAVPKKELDGKPPDRERIKKPSKTKTR